MCTPRSGLLAPELLAAFFDVRVRPLRIGFFVTDLVFILGSSPPSTRWFWVTTRQGRCSLVAAAAASSCVPRCTRGKVVT